MKNTAFVVDQLILHEYKHSPHTSSFVAYVDAIFRPCPSYVAVLALPALVA